MFQTDKRCSMSESTPKGSRIRSLTSARQSTARFPESNARHLTLFKFCVEAKTLAVQHLCLSSNKKKEQKHLKTFHLKTFDALSRVYQPPSSKARALNTAINADHRCSSQILYQKPKNANPLASRTQIGQGYIRLYM